VLTRYHQALRLGREGDTALAALQPWLAARGARLDGAQPAVFASGLRGLAFAADAPPDTVVLSVPLEATLSALTFSGVEQLRAAVAPGAPLGLSAPRTCPFLTRSSQTRNSRWARRRSRTCT
jgi:hypothetical protein